MEIVFFGSTRTKTKEKRKSPTPSASDCTSSPPLRRSARKKKHLPEVPYPLATMVQMDKRKQAVKSGLDESAKLNPRNTTPATDFAKALLLRKR